jgi:branched-chain amino acid transport system permease protein
MSDADGTPAEADDATTPGGVWRRYKPADPYGMVLLGALGFGLLALLPAIQGGSLLGYSVGSWLSMQVLILALIFAFTAQAWNIMSGFTGYFSFGHAAFFGIGAYTTMKLTNEAAMNPWITMIVGGLIAAALALLVGHLTFRYNLRGHYFALATFAIAMVVFAGVRNAAELGGSAGYYRPLPSDYGLDFGLLAFQFRELEPYYFLMLGFLLLVTVIAWLLKRSQIGYYMLAIRENESAARSLGIDAYRYKMMAFAVSAFFTAWAGTFWSMRFNTIRPDVVFNLFRNVEILLAAVVGGLGGIAGPIVGALFVFPIAEFFRIELGGSLHGIDQVIYGIALILVALFLPEGLTSIPKRIRKWREEREDSED